VEQRIAGAAPPLRETAAEHQHIAQGLWPEAEAVDAAGRDHDVTGRFERLGGIVDGKRHLSLRYQHDLHAPDMAMRRDFPVVQGTSRGDRLDMPEFRRAFGNILAIEDIRRDGPGKCHGMSRKYRKNGRPVHSVRPRGLSIPAS